METPQHECSRGRGGALAVILILSATVPGRGLAQATSVVQGRVYDPVSSTGIANAIVTLGGRGGVLTTSDGSFRLDRVDAGDYVLHVEAFGYRASEVTLSVSGDTTVAVPLVAEPLLLDSVLVEAGTLDFDGRVRDPARDYDVMDAHVVTDEGHEEWTNAHGRFDLDDAWAKTPMHMVITAFGYLPLDTTFIPDDEERYTFDLAPDPLAERMIARENRRLAERAGEYLYEYRPPMNRDVMARYMGTGTLQTMMEAKYPLNVLEKVVCLVVDERQVRAGAESAFVLRHTIPEELERVEVLEFHLGGDRQLMVRAYTRSFFQELIARNQRLRPPQMQKLPNRYGSYVCR